MVNYLKIISTMLSRLKNNIFSIIAVLLALLFWQIISRIVDLDFVVPPVDRVVAKILILIRNVEFLHIVFFSVSRIFVGSIIGITLGTLFGVLSGRFATFKTLFEPYFLVIKAVPVASFIIILLVWLSSKNLSIFISAIVVFSPIYSNTITGFQQTDKKLLEMAKVFKLTSFKKIKFIYLPSIYPVFMSALTLALGNAWKAGIAAEIIGLPDGSIGNELYKAKIYFETADMFAWTFLIAIFSFIFEKLLVVAVKRIIGRRF